MLTKGNDNNFKSQWHSPSTLVPFICYLLSQIGQSFFDLFNENFGHFGGQIPDSPLALVQMLVVMMRLEE